MRHIASAVRGLWLGFAVFALAQIAAPRIATAAEPVVVELFTSEGCSSCPPADEYLAEIADDPQVIALSLHVDYWDYIGWKDRFATPQYSDRQRAYAEMASTRSIYTPQMVIAGKDLVIGTNRDKIDGLIRSRLEAVPTVTLRLERQGDTLTIRAEAAAPLVQPLRVHLVRYIPMEKVSIERGENAGRVAVYRNIVSAWDNLGHWTGEAPLEMQTQVSGDLPVVVILQEDGPGRIYVGARVE